MNTPGKSRPRIVASSGLWKESACRPYALRSMFAPISGSPPSCGSANRIAPAQVPSTGCEGSERIHSKRAGKSPDSLWFPISRMVVDSPPGSTMA